MSVQRDQQQAKRALRAEIGRLRRRIDCRLRGVQQRGEQLIAWRGYLRFRPVYTVALDVLLKAGSLGWKGMERTAPVAFRTLRRQLRRLSILLWREARRLLAWLRSRDGVASAEGGDVGP